MNPSSSVLMKRISPSEVTILDSQNPSQNPFIYEAEYDLWTCILYIENEDVVMVWDPGEMHI